MQERAGSQVWVFRFGEVVLVNDTLVLMMFDVFLATLQPVCRIVATTLQTSLQRACVLIHKESATGLSLRRSRFGERHVGEDDV